MRILLVTPLAPWPPFDGARQRTNLLHRALGACGEVDTAIVSRTSLRISDEDMAVLKDRFGLVGCLEGSRIGQELPWRLMRIASASMPDRAAHMLGGWGMDYRPGSAASRWMREHMAGRSYDLIVGRYLWPIAHAGLAGSHPLIIDVDDLESERLSTFASSAGLGSLQRRWWGRRCRQIAGIERRLLARCDHAWLTKKQDQQAIGRAPASLLPNVPFPFGDEGDQGLPPAPNSRRILFVGAMDYGPNVRAVERFLERCWPQVRNACPAAEFEIVGNRMPEDARRRWSAAPGVRPVGFVEDLRSAYRDAAFTVVPIWEGAGTKIKVLESLMLGRTVVVTRHSLRGYEDHLADGQSVIVVDDDQSLTDGCIRLLQNPADRNRLAEQGRNEVARHYSADAFCRHVQGTIRQLLQDVSLETRDPQRAAAGRAQFSS